MFVDKKSEDTAIDSRNEDTAPPSYSEAVQDSSKRQDEQDDIIRPIRPSPNLSVKNRCRSINGYYALDLNNLYDEPENGYDAYFETKEGSVKITLEGIGVANVSRPVKIFVRSKEGSVKCSIVSTYKGPWDIEMTSNEGHVVACLPQHYSGDLNMIVKEGSAKLFPTLLSNSELRTESHYIVHSNSNLGQKSEKSTSTLKSKEGSIKVGLSTTSDEEEAAACHNSSCIIS